MRESQSISVCGDRCSVSPRSSPRRNTAFLRACVVLRNSRFPSPLSLSISVRYACPPLSLTPQLPFHFPSDSCCVAPILPSSRRTATTAIGDV